MTGRPKRVTDEEILKEVKLARGPVVTAKEISERVDMSPSGVNKRFDDLVENDYLRQREVGANAVVYWLTEDGKKVAEKTDS